VRPRNASILASLTHFVSLIRQPVVRCLCECSYDWAEGRVSGQPYFTLLAVRKTLKHGKFVNQMFRNSQMGRGLLSCKVRAGGRVQGPRSAGLHVRR
jgi:hypothetical protein